MVTIARLTRAFRFLRQPSHARRKRIGGVDREVRTFWIILAILLILIIAARVAHFLP